MINASANGCVRSQAIDSSLAVKEEQDCGSCVIQIN